MFTSTYVADVEIYSILLSYFDQLPVLEEISGYHQSQYNSSSGHHECL